MFDSGMVEVPRPFDRAQDMLQAKGKFVMPAKAGIHLGSVQVASTKMDSGLRRNDGSESRLRVDTNKIPRLQSEGCLILIE